MRLRRQQAGKRPPIAVGHRCQRKVATKLVGQLSRLEPMGLGEQPTDIAELGDIEATPRDLL
jgi:hypothetical protein